MKTPKVYIQMIGRALRGPGRHDEFCCIWFEQSQKWIVLFPDGSTIDENFGAIGYAVNAALKNIGAAEADFDCDEDTGTFYRYARADS